MTQAELELQLYEAGRASVLSAYQKNADDGRASSNPYASAFYRRTVEPLEEVLTLKYAEKTSYTSARNRIVAMLDGLDNVVVAYLTNKTLIDVLMEEAEVAETSLAHTIGCRLYGETLLRTFEDIAPAMFSVLTSDFKSRMSKSERHRVNAFRHQAEKLGIDMPEWSTDDRVLIGTVLIHELAELGIVEHRNVRNGKKTVKMISLPADTMDSLSSIAEQVALLSPRKAPCIEPPKDWITPTDGGWHTQEMRRSAPSCIQGRPFVDNEDVPAHRLSLLNHLQNTEWRINTRLLEAVVNVAQHFDMDEVVSQAELPKPHAPVWLTDSMSKEDMTEEQLAEFTAWKRSVAIWHTERKARGVKWGRFFRITQSAQQYKQYEKIYFVYTMDYRGRYYSQSTGVSPQGSDLQKALIRFSKGGYLHTDEAKFWFKVNGANRWGFDKAPLDERAQWVDEHHDFLIRMASDPLSFREWTEADKPFQFLAWCFEYADWCAFGNDFKTHIPVGLDGTCNGLQHMSAVLRDEVGGAATNLVPQPTQQDIYGIVAERTTNLLENAKDDEHGFRKMWLAHGITRKLVKRSVMTLPYGSTRFACSDFIMQDYLNAGYATVFRKDQYAAAATYLSHLVWKAIGMVLVKAPLLMQWLQNLAGKVAKAGHDELVWRTADGFVVRQRYRTRHTRRISCRLVGGIHLRPTVAGIDEDSADVSKHKNGVAPNVTHSGDGAHLTMTGIKCMADGIDLALIHDDYGARADEVHLLYKHIRVAFVEMYEQYDPLVELANAYPEFADELPAKGSLDIKGVLTSRYFFC